MRRETVAVHAGGEIDPTTGALTPAVNLSTTFEHAPDSNPPREFAYVREGNPTQTRLERALRELEGGHWALVYASGMAAGMAALRSLPSGAHVLFGDDIYYTFRAAAHTVLPRYGIESSFADVSEPAVLREAFRENTRLVWIETPSNPLMKIADIASISRLAREAGARVLVDNTFATAILQQPIALGADYVLHSTTKYYGGHSDVQGGCLIGSAADEEAQFSHARRLEGSVASPFNSWLVLRGLRTLACRMDRHSSNALAVAVALADIPTVERVYYPGLTAHPGHEIARRQMSRFGGMLSFTVRGGWSDAVRVASRLKLFINATSLGGTESLVEHRASIEGPHSTAAPNLLRLSVGLEHPDDLIEDLRQALAEVP